MENNVPDYMNDLMIIKRLIREWITHNSLIIAYDYDNTVYDYHNAGCDFTKIIDLLKECKNYGGRFIVYSCSPESRHLDMVDYLNKHNIPFDSINENIVTLHGGEGKLFYNILLDDRAGLRLSYEYLNTALIVMKQNPQTVEEGYEILKTIYGSHTNN